MRSKTCLTLKGESMRKFFLICALAIAGCAVMAPAAQATKSTTTGVSNVLNACDGDLQSGLGAFGCTICIRGTLGHCIDYSCNTNPANGAPLGCWRTTFIVKLKPGQPSPQATQMQWAPGWLSRNGVR
jgi:hypothetical protein